MKATLRQSEDEVKSGNPGDYFIAPDQLSITIRFPVGWSVTLPVLPAPGGWKLIWKDGLPSLEPSILTDNGVGTRWHGFLTNGELVTA